MTHILQFKETEPLPRWLRLCGAVLGLFWLALWGWIIYCMAVGR